MNMTNQHPWQLLLLMGFGIFIGSFWVIFGLLSVVGTSAVWWTMLVALAPGSAIVFLVLMARRAPVPYGTAMIIMGLLVIVLSSARGHSMMTGLVVGAPVFVLGLGFVWLNKIVLTGATK
jgi:hypothetical protein